MPKLLKTSDKEKTFFIDLGDGSGEEGVCVVPLTDTELDRLRRQFTERKVTRSGIREELDSTSFFHARLKRTIKAWKGFVDLDGKDIPCTPENIVECAEMNTMLFMEIISRMDRLAEEGQAVAEKNLGNGRSGISKQAL
jgi:hypothetical protein